MKALFILILLSFAVTCSAQTYSHPTTGMAGEFVGACMASTCSGTYSDGGGNYAAGINNIYRTFCPNSPGMCSRICFNSIAMATGNCIPGNVPCDILQIGNGPTQNSPLIATIDYNANGTTPCYTATSSSGCLTFRLRSVIGGAAGWSATLSCVSCSANTVADNNDCISSTAICSNSSFSGASVGPGTSSEGCSGCNTSEHFSNWYRFCAQTSGSLRFVIDPAVNTQDYDFALYGPNVTCTSLGSPVRCSYAAVTGNTGLRTTSVDNSEDVSGDGYVAPLNITAGQCYYLMISQWSAGGAGFTIDFTGTTASLDCIVLPVELTNFDVEKQEDVIVINWTTSSELNNNYFVVEKSRDNLEYIPVVTLRGQGTTTSTTLYTASDGLPWEGISYYRLKQVDLDGKVTYSDVRSINWNRKNALVTLPGETEDIIQVVFNATGSRSETIRVYDYSGRQVYSSHVVYTSGSNNIKLDLSGITGGMYFVTLEVDDTFYNSRIVKR